MPPPPCATYQRLRDYIAERMRMSHVYQPLMLVELLKRRRQQLRAEDATISGWNVGLNSGETAGQTVFHAHWHLIPRREGDCEDPRGGVRGVIPTHQIY
jgi:diadenosine tetraphosphate (Ap4A) HIT family hydrolase